MANLKIPMEGKIEIELSEEAKDILQRFISAVERLEDRDESKNFTIEVNRTAIRKAFEEAVKPLPDAIDDV